MRRPQELHWCGNILTIWILLELFELLELWGKSGPIWLILRKKQEAEILATGDFQDILWTFRTDQLVVTSLSIGVHLRILGEEVAQQ